MSVTVTRRHPSTAARRSGYVAAIVVNAAMLFAVNVWPGWQVVPFLTQDTRLVLGFVNASMLAGVLANVVYLVDDSRRVKALGDLVTTAIGLAAVVRVWQVFPFAFSTAFDWALVFHILLVVAMVGSAIAVVVQLVTLVRPGAPRRS